MPDPIRARRLAALLPSPFIQVLCAIFLGVLFGSIAPAQALQLKPIGDAFVEVISLLVGPIVFFTMACGVAALGNGRQMGRLGIKTLLCFESFSLLALLIGLGTAALLQPGAGFGVAVTTSLRAATGIDQDIGAPAFWQTLGAALAGNGMLQLMVLGVVAGLVIAALGPRGRKITAACERITGWLFRLIRLVLMAIPLAAFAAIAYAVGRYGLGSIGALLKMLGVLYLATGAFCVVVLGIAARLSGFSLLRFIAYLREELVLVFATSSSVTAMPGLIAKLEQAGCARVVVGTVVPAGYSFNLTGSTVYLAAALVFLAQVAQVPLAWHHYLAMLLVTTLTSRGATGVAGSAFVALTATLAFLPPLPPEGLALLFSIERLLKCRVLGNLLGNGVACLSIAAWSGQLDREQLEASGLGRHRPT